LPLRPPRQRRDAPRAANDDDGQHDADESPGRVSAGSAAGIAWALSIDVGGNVKLESLDDVLEAGKAAAKKSS
jgi:hypothetical protein